jgi:hypothetical protein
MSRYLSETMSRPWNNVSLRWNELYEKRLRPWCDDYNRLNKNNAKRKSLSRLLHCTKILLRQPHEKVNRCWSLNHPIPDRSLNIPSLLSSPDLPLLQHYSLLTFLNHVAKVSSSRALHPWKSIHPSPVLQSLLLGLPINIPSHLPMLILTSRNPNSRNQQSSFAHSVMLVILGRRLDRLRVPLLLQI